MQNIMQGIQKKENTPTLQGLMKSPTFLGTLITSTNIKQRNYKQGGDTNGEEKNIVMEALS